MKKLLLFIFIFLSFIYKGYADFDRAVCLVDDEADYVFRISSNDSCASDALLGHLYTNQDYFQIIPTVGMTLDNNTSTSLAIGSYSYVRFYFDDIGPNGLITIKANNGSTISTSNITSNQTLNNIPTAVSIYNYTEITNKIVTIMGATSSGAINTGTETMESNFGNIIYFIIGLSLISLIMFLFYFYIEKKGK